MRWKAKDYSKWHSYFVWVPMQIDGEWIWLERIFRKGRSQIQPLSVKNSKYRWEYVNSEFDLIKRAETEDRNNYAVQEGPPNMKAQQAAAQGSTGQVFKAIR